MKEENWDFYVDTGGTFTDCLGRGSNGRLERAKVLSRGSLSAEVISYLKEGCMALSVRMASVADSSLRGTAVYCAY